MIRISLFILSLLILHSFNTFAQRIVKLEDFSQINISGGHELELIRSKERELLIEMVNGNESDINVEVTDGKLKIKTKGIFNTSRVKAKMKLKLPTWGVISASAGARVFSLENWSGDDLLLKSSSGAKLKMVVNAGIVSAQVSSGAYIALRGTAQGTKFKASSGAELDAIELKSNLAEVDCSSGSSVKLWVNEELRAKASSGGAVRYIGNTERVETNKTSGGVVDRL